MFGWLIKLLGLDPNDRAIKRYQAAVAKINALADSAAALSDDELAGSKEYFSSRLNAGECLDDILPEVFARVREVSSRKMGMRHFDVQLIGGMALNDRKIAEMRTGEGKTLVATLAAVLNALDGKGVHVVTVNDYLARRDAEWMSPIYNGMGLSVGVIVPFMDEEERKAAYRADITYGTNSEFGFDYLRDNMAHSLDMKVQRGHNYCIVDEVDSILIDEARTPLIISGPSEDNIEPYRTADSVARALRAGTDFEIEEKERSVALTEDGIAHCESILGLPELFTDFEHSQLTHKIIQSLKAHHLFKRDTHYLVKDGEIVIIDEFTGRLMVGRRYSEGLHQAIEAKERVRIGRENQTLATITLQNYFRMYSKLAGMTGTAMTEAEEFKEIYGLDVVSIPTHKPMIRKDSSDSIYMNKTDKFKAAADEIEESFKKGQPVLVGTSSVENSERMSKLLTARKIPHNVLNAKVHDKEAMIVAQAGRLNAVTVATNMAGRGTDIVLGGNADLMAREEAAKHGVDESSQEYVDLRQKFRDQCAQEHDKVIELGGLRIVGVERHESRRIDNQLRGRSGRQGDPGESRFYVALDDDLLRLFGGERIQGIMSKLGMKEGDSIEHSLLNRTIEGAQKKIEAMHFDIRKQLLSFDNVMNQQREAIYKERDEILTDEDVVERVANVLKDTLDSLFDNVSEEGEEFETSRRALAMKLRSIFWQGADDGIADAETKEDLEERRDALKEDLQKTFDAKIEEIGREAAERHFRFVLLHTLDTSWREHLLNMDELRRGIGLRAIGQKDPLLEYQFESFNLFQTMLSGVREKVTEYALKISASKNESSTPRRAPISRSLLFSSFSSESSQSRTNTTVKKGPKVGRNDPCPCGSGKKYKHCCGRSAS